MNKSDDTKDDMDRWNNPVKPIGSCPHCGKNIWESDRATKGVWRCITCRRLVEFQELLPF